MPFAPPLAGQTSVVATAGGGSAGGGEGYVHVAVGALTLVLVHVAAGL